MDEAPVRADDGPVPGHDRRITVAGVDGCPGGWVVVTDGPRLRAEVVADLGPLVAAVRAGIIAAVAVDMPMGLLADRSRLSDQAARAVLGPRRSSVFPTPVRAVLAARSYPEACELSRAACGKALSKQAWFLVERIRQLDQLIEPADQDRLVEAHPECAFLRLAGEPLASKKTADGVAARRHLLARRLGPRFTRLWHQALEAPPPPRRPPAPPPAGGRPAPAAGPDPADSGPGGHHRPAGGPHEPYRPAARQVSLRRAGVRPDDLLDAAVLTVTARHLLAGTSIHLGPERDPQGKLCQVVY